MRTETKILVSAMYELAGSVQCDDGIANSAIEEAAQRLDEQGLRINMLETALKTTMTTLKQIAETPRNAGAKRNATATVKFLQTQGMDA
jgi:hypothetical protein